MPGKQPRVCTDNLIFYAEMLIEPMPKKQDAGLPFFYTN